MKKYIFMAVAGMLALSSCSNDDNDKLNVQNTPRQMSFTAGYNEGAQMRTYMDFHLKVSFSANDEISILSEHNANVKFTTTAGGESATFTGTAVDDTKFYAVYPYTAGLTLSGTTITGVTIPTSQMNNDWIAYRPSGISASWDLKAPIAWAETTGSNLQFHNLCAILYIYTQGFTPPGTGATITISADQSLAGTFSLDTSSGELTATAGSNTITIGSAPNDLLVKGNHQLEIAIAPGTYTNFRVVSKMSGSDLYIVEDKTKSGSVTFEAGKVYNLGGFMMRD